MPEGIAVGPTGAAVPVPQKDWPPDLLYIHLSSKIEDLKSHMGDLRTADNIALAAALNAAEKAVSAALNAQEKATEKYEREIREWRQASNEWRGALQDRDIRFVEQSTLDARIAGMNQRADGLDSKIDQRFEALDGKIDDLTRSRDLSLGRQTALTALIGVIFAAITIALRFI